MNITLYTTTSENNRVDKQLRNPISMTGKLKEESNVIDPVILFEVGNISGYNYCYIEDFGRYYFITEITSVRNGLWKVSLHVDVLFTYRTQIKKLSAVIDKQEGTNYTSDLYNDGSFRIREDNFIEVKEYSNGFNDAGEFILLTAGAISGGN